MAKAKTKKRDAATGVSAGLTPMRPCTELCKSSWTKAQNADPILELEHDIDFVSPVSVLFLGTSRYVVADPVSPAPHSEPCLRLLAGTSY